MSLLSVLIVNFLRHEWFDSSVDIKIHCYLRSLERGGVSEFDLGQSADNFPVSHLL